MRTLRQGYAVELGVLLDSAAEVMHWRLESYRNPFTISWRGQMAVTLAQASLETSLTRLNDGGPPFHRSPHGKHLQRPAGDRRTAPRDL